ncbi:cytochrome [Salmonella enterica]|nr:cytochrome [Salmonella enterica]EIO3990332.1 cytochrome [Salmonella enterica]
MNVEEMLKALSPKRESLTINGFTFYARPMTVAEFNSHIMNRDKNGRDEIAIMNCIVDENGKQVFKNIKQVNGMFTTTRAELVGLVAQASLMASPSEVEEEVK